MDKKTIGLIIFFGSLIFGLISAYLNWSPIISFIFLIISILGLVMC